MKNKIFSVLCAVLVSAGTIFAQTVELDGLTYTLNAEYRTAEVSGCSLSGDVVIPASVMYSANQYDVISIGNTAFQSRTWASVTIPSSVTFIGGGAFEGAMSPQYVMVNGTTPATVSSSSFPYDLTIYVPCFTLAAYQKNWSKFAVQYMPKNRLDSVICNTNGKGTVLIERNTVCDEGDKAYATLTVKPSEGYDFVQWNDGNKENPRTIEVVGRIEMTAEFVNHNTDLQSVTVNGVSIDIADEMATMLTAENSGTPVVEAIPVAEESKVSAIQTVDNKILFEVEAENGDKKEYVITCYVCTANFSAEEIKTGTQKNTISATTYGDLSLSTGSSYCVHMLSVGSNSKYIQFIVPENKELAYINYTTEVESSYWDDNEFLNLQAWNNTSFEGYPEEYAFPISRSECEYKGVVFKEGVKAIRITKKNKSLKVGDFSLALAGSVIGNAPVPSAEITGLNSAIVGQEVVLKCVAPNATDFVWKVDDVDMSNNSNIFTFKADGVGKHTISCEAWNAYTATPVVAYFEVTVTALSAVCGMLAKVQATSYNTASLTGTFTGTPAANLSTKEAEKSEYEGEVGYKLSSSGRYLGATFDEGQLLQAGDKVTVFVTTTSPKMQIFADKEGTTLLAETETVVQGENVIYLDERAHGAQGIYVCRVLGGTEGAQYNAFVAYIAVERACIDDGYYQVIFKDWDGTVLSSETVASGAAATAPKDPVREGYTFTGWNKDFSAVTEAMTITAQYQINTYTVDFLDWDDTVLKSEKVNFNESATAPKDPSREWYTFIGWDKDFSAVKSNMTVRALYSEGQTNMYTVRFTSSTNNSEISNTRVQIDMPVPPTFEGFTFLRWEMKAGELVDVIEIQAVYEANEPTSAPEVYTNPANPAQKLIRNGNVYILRGEKTYTVTGQKVR